MKYVGVDIGKKKCRAAIVNAEGKIVKELDFCNNSVGITSLASMLTMDDQVVMESTGPYWLDLYNQLDQLHKAFYERVAKRRGDQKAVVAVANKMLKIIWFMLTRKEPYESVDAGRYAKKLKSLNG